MTSPLFGAPLVAPSTYIKSMANVCKPVTIVSASTRDGEPYGTTVSAFGGLSLDPPMVTVALDRGSVLLTHVRQSGRFGVNVLARHQEDIAKSFAQSRPDKFVGTAWAWDCDLPRLADVSTWVACELDRALDGGDHVILLGRVVHAEATEALPLVYARHVFGTHSNLLAEPAH